MATKKSFDQAFEKAWVRDITREPDAIRKDLAKQESIQKESIRCCMELTADNRRRNKVPLRKPFEKLATDPAMQTVIGNHRAKYDAAAMKIAELEQELVPAEGVRV